jgi:Glycosyl transferase family 11
MDAVPGIAAALRATRIFAHAAKAASRINERWPLFGRSVATLREGRKPGELITPLESEEVKQRVCGARIVLVNGWTFRAGGCVQRQQDKVRTYFTPIEEHRQASRQVIERTRAHADVVVGVHIRRGDYAGWRQGRYFFPVERYMEWMMELKQQFPGRKVAFLVCSNELRSANEFPGLVVGFPTGIPVEDMFALAECDYIMGPVSSFSQWASFYGAKPLFHLTGADARVELEKFSVSYLGDVPH